MNQRIKLWIAQAMLLKQLIGQTGSALLTIKMIASLGGLVLGRMMIDHQPALTVKPRFHAQVTHPGDMLKHLSTLPWRQMVGRQGNIFSKQVLSQALKQAAGHKPIQITLMRQDDLRFLKLIHGGLR
jgi:hypothetical protein